MKKRHLSWKKRGLLLAAFTATTFTPTARQAMQAATTVTLPKAAALYTAINNPNTGTPVTCPRLDFPETAGKSESRAPTVPVKVLVLNIQDIPLARETYPANRLTCLSDMVEKAGADILFFQEAIANRAGLAERLRGFKVWAPDGIKSSYATGFDTPGLLSASRLEQTPLKVTPFSTCDGYGLADAFSALHRAAENLTGIDLDSWGLARPKKDKGDCLIPKSVQEGRIGKIIYLNSHADSGDVPASRTARLKQWEEIGTRLARYPDSPVLLAGDLNIREKNSAEMAAYKRFLSLHNLTEIHRHKTDVLLTRGISGTGTALPLPDISDHSAILATLDIPADWLENQKAQAGPGPKP